MEVKLQYNPVFGRVISTRYRGKFVGLRIEYDPSDDDFVRLIWVGLKGGRVRLELKPHYFLTSPNSLQEERDELTEFFSEMQLFGNRLWYIQPLVRSAIRTARKKGYFDHLDDEITGDLLYFFDEFDPNSYARQQIICYGFLELGLTFPVMEMLVPIIMEKLFPLVSVGSDLPRQ